MVRRVAIGIPSDHIRKYGFALEGKKGVDWLIVEVL